MSLENQTAVVTGAGRGIGRAIALKLAEAGADLILNGFGDAAVIAELCEELGATHSGADLTHVAQIEAMTPLGRLADS